MTDDWHQMTPNERARLIRGHRSLSEDAVCDLFGLTRAGLWAIMRGADWEPEYMVKQESDHD